MDILEQTYENYDLKLDGGESSNEAVERGMNVVREMIARPEESICVVTHGALLSLLFRQFNKAFGFEDWKKLSNPDVYKLEILGDQTVIERVWVWKSKKRSGTKKLSTIKYRKGLLL